MGGGRTGRPAKEDGGRDERRLLPPFQKQQNEGGRNVASSIEGEWTSVVVGSLEKEVAEEGRSERGREGLREKEEEEEP